MHDRIFTTRKLSPADLEQHASAIGLDVDAFRSCLNSNKYDTEIRNDMSEGRKGGVTGTPAFFLGLTRPGSDKVLVTKYIKGAQPYDAFREAIEELLKEKK
jgi:predicted DsbA family dithiol-disulfide isomerase